MKKVAHVNARVYVLLLYVFLFQQSTTQLNSSSCLFTFFGFPFSQTCMHTKKVMVCVGRYERRENHETKFVLHVVIDVRMS